MPLRPPAGFISAFYDPLKNPNAPTAVSASGGDESASVSFTPPANVGGSAISSYTAISTPGQFTGSAASSPVTVSGLTNGTAYTFAVWATNTYGPGPFSAASGSVTPKLAAGIFFSGNGGGYNRIDYINISTTGNATDFGDVAVNTSSEASFSSATRAFISGGFANGDLTNTIAYVLFASAGNTTDFGDLTVARNYPAGASNSTRGLTAGGDSFTSKNVIDYKTMSSSGNASDFGDLTRSCYRLAGCANPTRAVFMGGTQSDSNIIDYVTIASTGNASDFGDLTSSSDYDGSGGCSSGNTAFCMGGDSSGKYSYNWFNITTTGNAEYVGFGGGVQHQNCAALASSSRAVVAGNDGANGNTISYVTTATKGAASDFGDLTAARYDFAGCSSDQGGLQ